MPQFGFQGMRWDAGVGLYDDNARYYDPATGGFLTQDPAGQGPNPYLFDGNDPVDNTDPSGESYRPWWAAEALAGGLGGSPPQPVPQITNTGGSYDSGQSDNGDGFGDVGSGGDFGTTPTDLEPGGSGFSPLVPEGFPVTQQIAPNVGQPFQYTPNLTQPDNYSSINDQFQLVSPFHMELVDLVGAEKYNSFYSQHFFTSSSDDGYQLAQDYATYNNLAFPPSDPNQVSISAVTASQATAGEIGYQLNHGGIVTQPEYDAYQAALVASGQSFSPVVNAVGNIAAAAAATESPSSISQLLPGGAVDVATSLENNQYFFRGTTKGFPGGQQAQSIPVTYTSTNPAVATNYATAAETMFNEPGLVQIASAADLFDFPPLTSNSSLPMDFEIGFGVPPSTFSFLASTTVSAQQARDILSGMGYQLPSRIYSTFELNKAINIQTPALTTAEIQSFTFKARKVN